MEIGGGPVLRAVLRQLSTAAALRTLPTPCRARAPGAGHMGSSGDGMAIHLNARLGLREAWGAEGGGDAGLEVWDLDDGFSLPAPLLELHAGSVEHPLEGTDADFADFVEFESPVTPPRLGLGHEIIEEQGCSGEPSEEILHQMLVERLVAQPALLPLAAAVLAGGRRFPHARAGTRQAPTPGGSRWMRFRQQRRTPVSRQGSARNGAAGRHSRRGK